MITKKVKIFMEETNKEERTKKKQDKKLVEPQQESKQVKDNEEEAEHTKEMETGGEAFPSPLPPHIPLKKPNAKLVKDSKDEKFGTFTPLLPEKVPFNGELLVKILQLKFVDYDFNDRKKYPQFAPDR